MGGVAGGAGAGGGGAGGPSYGILIGVNSAPLIMNNVIVALALWDDPQLVLLASFEIHEVPYTVASMSVAFTELMEILEKLVFLNEDNEVLEQYVLEYDVMWRNRRSNRGS